MKCHIPLSEIDRWDLDDIRKANEFLDMENTFQAARSAYEDKKIQDKFKK